MDRRERRIQKAIQPGETFKYEYTLKQHGHFHDHSAPRRDYTDAARPYACSSFIQRMSEEPPDRDYAIMLSEWKIEVRRSPPDPIRE